MSPMSYMLGPSGYLRYPKEPQVARDIYGLMNEMRPDHSSIEIF